jgi:hypothetical protein
MPYVMVPVPEEHVEDVMQYILRALSRAAIVPWNEESIAEVYEGVDEVSRSLLAFTARSALEGKDLHDADAAKLIQLTAREISGVMNELAVLARDRERPALISSRTVQERLPNGRVNDKRVLLMDLDVAELVSAAERAELSGETHPLAGTAE